MASFAVQHYQLSSNLVLPNKRQGFNSLLHQPIGACLLLQKGREDLRSHVALAAPTLALAPYLNELPEQAACRA
jgi:hypothetical protein